MFAILQGFKRKAYSSAAGRLALVNEGNTRGKNQALVLMLIPRRVRPSCPDPNNGKTRVVFLCLFVDRTCALMHNCREKVIGFVPKITWRAVAAFFYKLLPW
jgi:hypothetical protein